MSATPLRMTPEDGQNTDNGITGMQLFWPPNTGLRYSDKRQKRTQRNRG